MHGNAFIDIQFKGSLLKPAELGKATGLSIESLAESGQIAKKGRYKGQASPYGLGILKVNPSADDLLKVVHQLQTQKAQILSYGVEEILVDIDANGEELEKLSFSNELIHALASLNAKVQFFNHDTEAHNVNLLKNKLLNQIKGQQFEDADSLTNVITTYANAFAENSLTAENVYALIVSLLERKPVSTATMKQKAKEFSRVS